MESLLISVGDFGKYQIINMCLLGSLATLTSIPAYSTVFTVAHPKLLCRYKYNETKINNVCEIWKNITKSTAMNTSTVYTCEFDTTYYGSTLVTEWSLICERKYLIAVLQAILLFGTLFGILGGWFGDRYGRKTSSVACAFLLSFVLLISQVLQLFSFSVSTKYVIYCIGQFFVGMFCYSLYMSAYVLCLEITTHRYHTRISIIQLYSYVVGELIVMVISYLARDWRVINCIITIICFFIAILNYLFLTESPAWLLSHRRDEETKKLLIKIAKLNQKPFAKEEFESILCNYQIKKTRVQQETEMIDEKKFTISKMLAMLFSPQEQLKKTLFLMYVWVAVSLVYYGVGLGITTLDESINPYVIYSFQSIFEIFGYTLSLINDKFGRRKTNVFYFFVAGVMCIVISFVPRNKDLINANKVLLDSIMIISLTAIGKCVVSASYNTCYVFSSEYFETSIRNFALAALSCFGQVGSFLAPLVNLLSDIWKPLPYLTFSLTSFFACFFAFLLPDTK